MLIRCHFRHKRIRERHQMVLKKNIVYKNSYQDYSLKGFYVHLLMSNSQSITFPK